MLKTAPVLLILLLASIQKLEGLLCYSNGSFYFSRNTFNWNDFTSILHNIKNEIISNTSICHVQITVDYNNEQNNYVVIKFSSSTRQYNTHIEFGSTMYFHQNEIRSIISHLDYSCSSGNFCDKIFLNKWAPQLLNANNNSLHTSYISLWKPSLNTPSKCNAKLETKECKSYLCFAVYDELKDLSYGRAQCNEKTSTNPVYIHIKTRGDHSNDYQCTKNHCTSQVVYDSKIGKNNVEESMYNGIDIKTNELNEIIFIRTIAIVGILLLIGGVAYYIQTRKYRQGYRLTTIA